MTSFAAKLTVVIVTLTTVSLGEIDKQLVSLAAIAAPRTSRSQTNSVNRLAVELGTREWVAADQS
jgi:hypothetical protein